MMKYPTIAIGYTELTYDVVSGLTEFYAFAKLNIEMALQKV